MERCADCRRALDQDRSRHYEADESGPFCDTCYIMRGMKPAAWRRLMAYDLVPSPVIPAEDGDAVG